MTNTRERPVDSPWMAHMRRGEFTAAWNVSDAALQSRAGVPCWHWPRHQQYIWNGTPLDRQRVLVRCYHGLGDTVQFVRYAPQVKAIAREVIVWAQPALLPLLRTIAGIDRLLPLHDGTPAVDYDVDVEIMELPHVFRTTLETLPANVPYLHAEPSALDSDSFNVGIVWSAGDWDGARSVPLRHFEPLFALSDVRIHALQRGAALGEWRQRDGPISGSEDVLTLASVLRALDLVITVDSFPAHLAGALGVPVWTLLRDDADWRWMLERSDSPWYPTMRLFRQTRAGDWNDIIARVIDALRIELSVVHESRRFTRSAVQSSD